MEGGELAPIKAKKVRLRYKVLAGFVISMLCSIVVVASVVNEPWRTFFVTILSGLLAACLGAALLFWIYGFVIKAVIRSDVGPAPHISHEDERVASGLLLNKILGSHLFVIGVVPLLLGVFVDIVTRAMPTDMAIPATLWIYNRGSELAVMCLGIYSIFAKLYELKSGVLLMPDRYTCAKKYLIYRYEIGIRKMFVLIVLLFDVPIRVGCGWVFITGLYLFLIKTWF